MRYITCLLIFFCLAANSPQTPTSSLEEGLVGHYTFNQCDARDVSGNDAHGRMVGNVNCWCGVEGEGLLLDGRSGYVTLEGAVNDVFHTADFSISFYVKNEGSSAFPQTVISKREGCNDEHILEIAVNTGTQVMQTDFRESEFKLFRELSPPLPATGWMHYTLVREGVRAHTYINGMFRKSSFRCSGVDISNTALLSIGESPCVRNGRSKRFRGVIDELRVYDRALSEEEVLQLYELNPIENAGMDCAT